MAVYPVRVEGELSPPLSRWLWLVKWFLLIPHIVILDFNLGVLRWTWRVAFYSYSALATDRYPPFSLSEEPDYPARLDIGYPEWQRKGFPLIGWWLLGIPQYGLASIFAGAGVGWAWQYGYGGVVDVLMVVVALLLLFKNTYREDV